MFLAKISAELVLQKSVLGVGVPHIVAGAAAFTIFSYIFLFWLIAKKTENVANKNPGVVAITPIIPLLLTSVAVLFLVVTAPDAVKKANEKADAATDLLYSRYHSCKADASTTALRFAGDPIKAVDLKGSLMAGCENGYAEGKKSVEAYKKEVLKAILSGNAEKFAKIDAELGKKLAKDK